VSEVRYGDDGGALYSFNDIGRAEEREGSI
jgi:hypothetical protein